MRLMLIRHGQTPSNVLGLLDTDPPGPGLTDLGIEQAAALPGTLADYRIDAIYASNQPRAQLTARPLAAARSLPIQVRDGLREVAAGELEMLGDDASTRRYQLTIRRWISGALQTPMPGGQSGAEVLDRFDAVVAEVVGALRRDAGEDGCAVLFSHGAMLRLWASVRASDPPAADDDRGRPRTLHNTGMIVLDGTADGWRVVSWAGAAIGGPRLGDGAADDPTGEDFAGPELAGRTVDR